MMNIALSTDHNYIMPAGVMICSVCVNHPNCDIEFHVICNNDVTESDKNDLRRIVDEYRKTIVFYKIDFPVPDCFSVGKEGQPKHITLASYYRFFLPQLLPDSTDRVLYLDTDLIVRHSLVDMYYSDMDSVGLLAVPNNQEGNILHYNRLRYPSHLGYFNAGVLLINLSYWRDNDSYNQAVEYATQNPEKLKFHDQDILNYIFRQAKKNLPLKYNLQYDFFLKEPRISYVYEKELEEAIKDPVIIHYNIKDKPWRKKCKHPYKDEFLKYRGFTKWAKEPLWPALPVTWRKKIRNVLIWLKILKKPFNPYKSITPLI